MQGPKIEEHRQDPVTEICTDFPVKIADLGNACWTVSISPICKYVSIIYLKL